MLTHLRISNIQSLQDIKLKLGRFTVVVGPSNAGKSAVIRAIHALAHNHRGVDIVRHGAKVAQVQADFSSGQVLTWRRGVRQSYILGDAHFDKIGIEVPQPVADLLLMTKEEIGPVSVDFNIARQFDAPFFVGFSAPTRAKVVAFVSGFDRLTEAVERGNAEKRQLSATLRELQSVQAKRPEFNKRKRLLQLVVAADDLRMRAAHTSQRSSQVDKVVERRRVALQTVDHMTMSALPELDALLHRADEVASLQRLIEAKMKLSTQVVAQTQMYVESHALVGVLDKLDLLARHLSLRLQVEMLLGELLVLPKQAVCVTCGQPIEAL